MPPTLLALLTVVLARWFPYCTRSCPHRRRFDENFTARKYYSHYRQSYGAIAMIGFTDDKKISLMRTGGFIYDVVYNLMIVMICNFKLL